MPFGKLFRRIIRDPRAKKILKEGLIPEIAEEQPYPTILVPPYNFVSRYIEETSPILRKPRIIAEKLGVKDEEKIVELRGSLDELRNKLVKRPGSLKSIYLINVQGSEWEAWLLAYYAVITGARVSSIRQGDIYGLEAINQAVSYVGKVRAVFYHLYWRPIAWGPRLSVYVQGLDREHMSLINAFNNMYRYILVGAEYKEIEKRIKIFIDVLRQHIDDEEYVLEKLGYPGIDELRKEHATLLGLVGRLVQDDKLDKVIEAVADTAELLETHIRGSDREYAEWLLKAKPGIADERIAENYTVHSKFE
ncbi:bacteriohemerythrin [Pyrofollis japonicus]|uniref:bacteriohemerythrin n=1 Tax=Pyrofollis japonicus TaxID=3060460 RepID=UPI00295B88CF|nr:hemerythrin family protein [Pyrofollis japonicus]